MSSIFIDWYPELDLCLNFRLLVNGITVRWASSVLNISTSVYSCHIIPDYAKQGLTNLLWYLSVNDKVVLSLKFCSWNWNVFFTKYNFRIFITWADFFLNIDLPSAVILCSLFQNLRIVSTCVWMNYSVHFRFWHFAISN